MPKPTLADRLEQLLFGHRAVVIGLFALATAVFGWAVAGLHIDAGFAKLLPLKHPYMATFLKHQQEFGGANLPLYDAMLDYQKTCSKLTSPNLISPGDQLFLTISSW